MARSIRLMTAALALGVAALGATEASARGGFGGGHGGGHGGGRGGFGGGFRHHGGFHHHRGWGPRFIGYGGFSSCYVKRFIDEDGDVIVRKICD